MKKLLKFNKDIILLKQTIAVLGWDQETYMPERAIESRAEQIALLESQIHKIICSKSYIKAIEEADIEERPNNWNKAEAKYYIKLIKEDLEREIKLPKNFVKEYSKAKSESQFFWIKAKQENNYSIFKPHLEKVVELTRKKAKYINPNKNCYDVLISEFDRDENSKKIEKEFSDLKDFLIDFIPKVTSKKIDYIDYSKKKFNKSKQEQLGRVIAEKMGYNFQKGSLDISEHPFTTTLGFNDIRITSNYIENDPFFSLYSTIHEAGHGIYEQGFDEKYAYTDLANAASLSLHESQSRYWENIICKSKSSTNFIYKEFTKLFGNKIFTNTKDFYNSINRVEPSLIRIQADELTYSLHIIIRFEIEKDLMNGKISVEDLPEIWNKKYKEYLNIEPQNHSEGILQDVHWSMGAFGYFPSYALGNIYGAQFFNSMKKDIPNLNELEEKGDFTKIKEWLNKNIHQYGNSISASKLCKKITGESLTTKYFKEYLQEKFM